MLIRMPYKTCWIPIILEAKSLKDTWNDQKSIRFIDKTHMASRHVANPYKTCRKRWLCRCAFASCRPFSFLRHLFFFWPVVRTIRGEEAFVFFLRTRFVFLGLFFFDRTYVRFPGWGPDGKLTIKFTCPNSPAPQRKTY